MAPRTGARTTISFTTSQPDYWSATASKMTPRRRRGSCCLRTKNVGGPLIATRKTNRTGDQTQTSTYESVGYEPIADSLFAMPRAVKALLKSPRVDAHLASDCAKR